MFKKFSEFAKKQKAKRWPYAQHPADVYDNHVDEIMHHLKKIHELTSKESLIHRAASKMGHDSNKYHAMHGHIKHIIKKHDDDSLEHFHND